MERFQRFQHPLTCENTFHHPFQLLEPIYLNRTKNLHKTDMKIPPDIKSWPHPLLSVANFYSHITQNGHPNLRKPDISKFATYANGTSPITNLPPASTIQPCSMDNSMDLRK